MNVTFGEYIEVIASLKYLFEQQFQCHIEEKYSRLMNAQKLKDQLHFKNACFRYSLTPPTPNHRYNGVEFLTCPCAFYNPEINTLYEYYREYEKFGLSALSNIFNNNGFISYKLYSIVKIIEEFINIKKAEEQARLNAELARKK
jgi:hypothetical protein